MSFTGQENHSITLQEASEWTANYRETISSGDTIAHFFGKDAINSILAQSGCVGIRIYYALDQNGAKHLILVGADSSENDLYNGVLAEMSQPCPNHCSSSNPLNS